MAAIVQSEGVFIDCSPLGKATASRPTQQTSGIRIEERRVADIRTMI
jgi:hypothetical protein